MGEANCGLQIYEEWKGTYEEWKRLQEQMRDNKWRDIPTAELEDMMKLFRDFYEFVRLLRHQGKIDGDDGLLESRMKDATQKLWRLGYAPVTEQTFRANCEFMGHDDAQRILGHSFVLSAGVVSGEGGLELVAQWIAEDKKRELEKEKEMAG
jgi:hypothetical protein